MNSSTDSKRKSVGAFAKFCITTIPLAALSVVLLLYFGSSVGPEKTGYQQREYNSRALEAITLVNSIAEGCIKEQSTPNSRRCENLIKIFEISRGSLDLAAQESVANSTFLMSEISYWQFIAAGLTVIFLMMTVVASYAFLYEASETSKAAIRTAEASEKGQRAYMLWAEDPKQPQVVEGIAFYAPIYFENVGQTPALHVKAATGFSLVDINQTSDFKVDVNIDQLNMQSHHVGVNKPFLIRIWVRDKRELHRLLLGKASLIIGVIFEYEDIFGQQNDIREFAFRISAVRVEGTLDNLRTSFVTTPVSAELGIVNSGLPDGGYVSMVDEPDLST